MSERTADLANIILMMEGTDDRKRREQLTQSALDLLDEIERLEMEA